MPEDKIARQNGPAIARSTSRRRIRPYSATTWMAAGTASHVTQRAKGNRPRLEDPRLRVPRKQSASSSHTQAHTQSCQGKRLQIKQLQVRPSESVSSALPTGTASSQEQRESPGSVPQNPPFKESYDKYFRAV